MSLWPEFTLVPIARNRILKRLLAPTLPETASLALRDGFRVFFDVHDVRGPSFYLAYGGADAFSHYEGADRREVEAAVPRGSGVFFDIGANIGLFGLGVARAAPLARVYAFEPHPRLYRCLESTRAANGLERFTAVHAAVGANPGSIDLLLNRRDSGGHSARRDQIAENDITGQVRVPLLSIDAFVAERGIDRLDVMKIDVQGLEWEVLRGARETLRRFRPKVLVELENRPLLAPDRPLETVLGELGLLSQTRIRLVGAPEFTPLEAAKATILREAETGHVHSNYWLRFD